MSARAGAAIALLFTMAGCFGEKVSSVHGAQTETLALSDNSLSLIAGTYMRNGVLLQFEVNATSMSLRAAGGAPLLQFSANPDGSNSLDILGVASVFAWIDANGEAVEGDSGDVDSAIAVLMDQPEMQIAPFLSPALAANGASGIANPMSMQLHALLAQIGSATGVDVVAANAATTSMCDLGSDGSTDLADGAGSSAPERAALPSATAARLATPADECQDISGDPYCNNCLGMCGPGCTCWRWVCGDCCWHRGCYRHDVHCRRCDNRHRRDCLLCVLLDFGRPYFTC